MPDVQYSDEAAGSRAALYNAYTHQLELYEYIVAYGSRSAYAPPLAHGHCAQYSNQYNTVQSLRINQLRYSKVLATSRARLKYYYALVPYYARTYM